MRPTTKDIAWERGDGELHVMIDRRRMITLADPDGTVEQLLALLRAQAPPLSELPQRLPVVTGAEAAAAVEALDGLGLLVDASRPALDQEERYFSNLAFFDYFASLSRDSRDFQQDLRDARVVQLGVGGLGSTVLMNLAGLGVGHITLLDSDNVELRNFVRQFLYTEADIGRSKVERAAAWARSFNSSITVHPVNRRVTGPNDLTDLLAGADLVISGIDQPINIDRWVNEACVRAGVPWVRGGMWVSQGVYFSVDPGHSSCLECLFSADQQLEQDPGPAGTAARLGRQLPRKNRGIGPVASLLGSLVCLEGLRYLTRYEKPIAAGAHQLIDFAAGCAQTSEPWDRHPDCPVCAGAGVA